ncbi:MAG: hypothetical protein KDB22_12830 [Planctomycetales bacterium]|nr:hypothetical protein [Planctomycetales bacterium]
MVSSLGLDVRTGCAAARAGLSRTVELDCFTNWSPVDGAITPVVAHQIPQITAGFEGPTRLGRILAGAIADFNARNRHFDWTNEKSGWYIALPDPHRDQRGWRRMVDQEARDEREPLEKTLQSSAEIQDTQYASRIFRLATSTFRPAKSVPVRWLSHDGNCAVANCLRQALFDLDNRVVDTALIAAADSWLDEGTLTWLHQTGRLKSPEIPTGLAPGEAGVVLCLQSSNRSYGEEQPVVQIEGVHTQEEEQTFYSASPITGNALGDLLKSTVDGSAAWLLVDLNGEEYRSMEWGYALVRAQAENYFATFPATEFGDTGVASAAVAIATVDHALRRRCASAKRAVVFSGSEERTRTAVVLQAVA